LDLFFSWSILFQNRWSNCLKFEIINNGQCRRKHASRWRTITGRQRSYITHQISVWLYIIISHISTNRMFNFIMISYRKTLYVHRCRLQRGTASICFIAVVITIYLILCYNIGTARCILYKSIAGEQINNSLSEHK